jgi:hypothetical protein
MSSSSGMIAAGVPAKSPTFSLGMRTPCWADLEYGELKGSLGLDEARRGVVATKAGPMGSLVAARA